VHLDKQIWKELQKVSKPTRRINWPLLVSAAACILICSLFYLSSLQTNSKKISNTIVTSLPAGGNKAELILEDGSVMPLKGDKTGLLSTQSGVVITQVQGGRLTYNASGSPSEEKAGSNMLRTPKGGQYQIDLPDGTRAWLNAASSVKFPTVFNGTERTVEISGEVYFEVAVNKRKPFKVISAGQTIEVLGTHFNVSTYPDERLTKTTLFEGSVKVNSGKNEVIIKPGEQSIFNSSTQKITVNNTDLEEALAWRQGYFQFNDEDIKSIMRKLSRWYDIDVDYSANFVNQRFTGSVSRFESAGKVLKMLEYTGTVHFKTEGRRVTVMP
jgi:transmembrane sensor